MDKQVLVYICIIVLSSCISQDKKYKVEYYPTGELYRKYSINDTEQLDGDYIEFYKNGEIKIFTTMTRGVFSDSLSYYTNKGKLVAKGMMKNNGLRIGWWRELDSISNKIVFRDYSIVDEKNYISQELYLNEKLDTIFSNSRFFKLDFKNKLKQGANLARLKYYNGISTEKSELSLVINNVSKVNNDTLVFNDKNICYFPYDFEPTDSIINMSISESIYFKKKSIEESKLLVKSFNIIFKLKLGESTFFGNSFYNKEPVKRVIDQTGAFEKQRYF